MNDQINLSIVSAEEDEESGGTENEMSGDNNGPCEDNSGDHCIVVSRNDIAQSGQLLDATAEVQLQKLLPFQLKRRMTVHGPTLRFVSKFERSENHLVPFARMITKTMDGFNCRSARKNPQH